MQPKYFNLLTPAYDRFGKQAWGLRFPWIPEEIDFRSQGRLAGLWNARTFAFSTYRSDSQEREKLDFPEVFEEGIHACSERMAKTLEAVAPGAIEFLPFRTRNSVGDDQTDAYRLMHYLQWCDAIDRKKSRLAEGETRFTRSRQTGGDYLLDHVVVVTNKLSSPICRLVGWSEYHVFREDVVEALNMAGYTGLDFEEIEVS